MMKLSLLNNVSLVNPLAFTDCTRLAEIEVASGNANYSSYNSMLFTKSQDMLVLVPPYYKSVILSDTSFPAAMVTIGPHAMQSNLRVTHVLIPFGVTDIGTWAFVSSKLTYINIPQSVTYIGVSPFFGCGDLKYIGLNCQNAKDLPSEDKFAIASGKKFDGTFYFPVGTHYQLSGNYASDHYPEYYVKAKKEYGSFDLLSYIDGDTNNPLCYDLTAETGSSLATAEVVPGRYSGTFMRPMATSVTIPSTVSSRGENYTVTALGYAAFIQNTTVTSITVPNTVTKFYGDVDNCYGTNDTPIDGFQFAGCSNLVSIKLPSDLEYVPTYCFYNTDKLKYLILPYGVKRIGLSAFRDSGLEQLLVPSSVERFTGKELRDATKLKTLFLNIPYDRLGDADGNGSYDYDQYVVHINIHDLYSMPSNMNVYIPVSESYDNGTPEPNSKWTNDNLFKRHNVHIGSFDFYYDNGSTRNYLTVTSPCQGSFAGRAKFVYVPTTLSGAIKTVDIGGTVTDYFYTSKKYAANEIESYAFMNASMLNKVTLSTNLYDIPHKAFCGTTALKSFPFTDSKCQSLKTIGMMAFSGSGLSGSVVLPGENLTDIGYYAFMDCKSLSKLYVRYHPNFTVGQAPIFEGMADNFICYVDHRRFPYYYRSYTGQDSDEYSYSGRIRPFLNPSHNWTTASFPKLYDSKGNVAKNYSVSLANVFSRGGTVYALGAGTPSTPGTILKTEMKASGNSGTSEAQGYLIQAEAGNFIELTLTDTEDLKPAGNKLSPSAMAVATSGGQLALTDYDYQYCRQYGIYTLVPTNNGDDLELEMQSSYKGDVGEAYLRFNPHPELLSIKIVDEAEPGSGLKGDVNLDGNVDISDIVAVINTIAGDNKFKETANVNGDTSIDISDIVAIINIIAGQ